MTNRVNNLDSYLKLIEIIAVLSIFNHSTKYQQPCAIADKPICSTTWRNITTDRWDEPLVCSYKYKYDIDNTVKKQGTITVFDLKVKINFNLEKPTQILEL